MKCPHCGQEHPDSFQFCPTIGKEIEQNEEFLGCSNIECPDFGKRVLPLDSKFCPTCGAAVSSEKNALSLFLQKLKDGVVDYGGIVLGRTKIGDLRRLGFRKSDESKKFFYVFDNDENDSVCAVCNCSMREINDPNFLEDLNKMVPCGSGLINKSVLVNKEKNVSVVGFSVEDAIGDDMELWELANLIEDCGFSEIEIDNDDYDGSEYDFAFVSDDKICGDYHALLEISGNGVMASICPQSEWILKKTGETIRA